MYSIKGTLLLETGEKSNHKWKEDLIPFSGVEFPKECFSKKEALFLKFTPTPCFDGHSLCDLGVLVVLMS